MPNIFLIEALLVSRPLKLKLCHPNFQAQVQVQVSQGSGEGQEGQSQAKSSSENSKLKDLDLSSTLFLVFTTTHPPQTWVGLTQVGSEEVRTSRWKPRQRSSGTTGGTSGSTSMSLKLSDSFMKS